MRVLNIFEMKRMLLENVIHYVSALPVCILMIWDSMMKEWCFLPFFYFTSFSSSLHWNIYKISYPLFKHKLQWLEMCFKYFFFLFINERNTLWIIKKMFIYTFYVIMNSYYFWRKRQRIFIFHCGFIIYLGIYVRDNALD